MKSISHIIISLSIILCSFVYLSIPDEVVNSLKTGNAAVIGKYFGSNVDLSIPGNESLCSKAQAELILKDFFSKNQVKSFTTLHQGESKDGSQYLMGNMTTSTGNYRVSIYMKKNGDVFQIKELRIEQ